MIPLFWIFSYQRRIRHCKIVKILPWKVFWPLNSGIIGLWSPPMQLISQLHSTTDSFLFSFAVNSHFEVSSFQNAFVISVLNLVLFVNLSTVSHLELYHYIMRPLQFATNSETGSRQKKIGNWTWRKTKLWSNNFQFHHQAKKLLSIQNSNKNWSCKHATFSVIISVY